MHSNMRQIDCIKCVSMNKWAFVAFDFFSFCEIHSVHPIQSHNAIGNMKYRAKKKHWSSLFTHIGIQCGKLTIFSPPPPISTRYATNRKEFQTKLLSKWRGCSALDREEIMLTSKNVQRAACTTRDPDVIEFMKNDYGWIRFPSKLATTACSRTNENAGGVSNTRASIVALAITQSKCLMTTTKSTPSMQLKILKCLCRWESFQINTFNVINVDECGLQRYIPHIIRLTKTSRLNRYECTASIDETNNSDLWSFSVWFRARIFVSCANWHFA